MPQAEKPSPLVGEGGGEADERGKLEKKRKNRNTCEQNTTTILTCVRTLAPIASQARHFPPSSGEADTKEKENYIFYYFYIRIYVYPLPDSLLRVRLCFSFHHHSDIFRCSRMTARMKCVFEKQ